MLEKAKKIIERATDKTTKVSFVNYGFLDSDIAALKEFLEGKPHITEIDLSNNNLTAKSAETLSSIGSLKRISLAENGIGDEGARILLAKKNLEFLDLEQTGITFRIADFLAERRAKNVEIFTSSNPKLNPNYPNVKVDPELIESTATFEPQGSAVTRERHLSRAKSVEKFGMRSSVEKTPSVESSPEQTDLRVEDRLLEQFGAYLEQHPERSSDLLSRISGLCSSLKLIK
ncbi:MAG TPA: hypothetical protein VGV92_00850 [Gammaproteobacteria bacterium]|nr:hypothetical protein [Gammaproteobacteria bacterium]